MNRSQRARIAALKGWAKTADRTARTEPMRTGLIARFEREARAQLGPDATDLQVADAADAARRAWYQEISAAGHAARYGRPA